jgi:hypothetical protein
MIGQLGSYQDVYVAACGEPFRSRRRGVEHEEHCWACHEVLGTSKDTDTESTIEHGSGDRPT